MPIYILVTKIEKKSTLPLNVLETTLNRIISISYHDVDTFDGFLIHGVTLWANRRPIYMKNVPIYMELSPIYILVTIFEIKSILIPNVLETGLNRFISFIYHAMDTF